MKADICTASKISPPVYLTVIGVLLIAAVLAAVFALGGCYGGKKYSIDYNGQKSCYENARDDYRAGERVILYYGLIATDTDYSFYLDEKNINPDYDENRGFVIEFIMPEHDVSLKCSSRNTMTGEPETDDADEETMLVDYYTAVVGTVGGDRHREIVLYSYPDARLKLSVFEQSYGEDETRTDYLVPSEALEECRRIIKKNRFSRWNDKCPDVALCGGVTAVRFRQEDGTYVRVSTDKMPEDGERKMDEIGIALSGYAAEKYKVN